VYFESPLAPLVIYPRQLESIILESVGESEPNCQTESVICAPRSTSSRKHDQLGLRLMKPVSWIGVSHFQLQPRR
jgi:hypothetical protein